MSGRESNDLDRRTALRGVTKEDVAQTRRGLLKRTIVAGVGAIPAIGAFVGRGAATADYDEDVFSAARSYSSPSAVRAALRDHAGDTLEDLAEEGVLQTASPVELPVTKLHETLQGYTNADAGAMVFAREKDGEPSPKIEIRKPLSSGETLVLVVEPTRGRSYATTFSDSPTLGTSSVGTADCTYGGETYCEVHCSPDGNCACIETTYCYYYDECYTGDGCSGCSNSTDC
jgi:hypothetical protein